MDELPSTNSLCAAVYFYHLIPVKELKAECKRNGLRGISKLKKQGLIRLLMDYHDQKETMTEEEKKAEEEKQTKRLARNARARARRRLKKERKNLLAERGRRGAQRPKPPPAIEPEDVEIEMILEDILEPPVESESLPVIPPSNKNRRAQTQRTQFAQDVEKLANEYLKKRTGEVVPRLRALALARAQKPEEVHARHKREEKAAKKAADARKKARAKAKRLAKEKHMKEVQEKALREHKRRMAAGKKKQAPKRKKKTKAVQFSRKKKK